MATIKQLILAYYFVTDFDFYLLVFTLHSLVTLNNNGNVYLYILAYYFVIDLDFYLPVFTLHCLVTLTV
jgi:hypothetical protein